MIFTIFELISKYNSNVVSLYFKIKIPIFYNSNNKIILFYNSCFFNYSKFSFNYSMEKFMVIERDRERERQKNDCMQNGSRQCF